MTRRSGWATVRYAVGWLVPLLVVAFVVTRVLGDERRDLERAAQRADCVVRHDSAPREEAPDVMTPPTFGPALASPARAGIYAQSPPRRALVAALRRGFVVVQYRPGLLKEHLAALQALVRSDADMIIFTPDATGMPYALAATAWQQLLGCNRVHGRSLDAVAAFRDHYRDQGAPDD